MKKFIPIIALLVVVFFTGACSKPNVEEAFDMSQLWWKGDTYGKNTTMDIRFVSPTEFQFKDQGNSGRLSYDSGKGTYSRTGNNVTFSFETKTHDLAPAHMLLLSGTWDKYPTTKEEARNAKLTVEFEHWTNMGQVEGEHTQHTTIMSYDFSENGW